MPGRVAILVLAGLLVGCTPWDSRTMQPMKHTIVDDSLFLVTLPGNVAEAHGSEPELLAVGEAVMKDKARRAMAQHTDCSLGEISISPGKKSEDWVVYTAEMNCG